MEEMMASDVKKSKVDPAPAKEAAPKKEAVAAEKKESVAADKSTPDATPAKAEGGESPAASYSRGEGQKAVTKAYKDNWNLIFGKEERKTKAKKPTKKATKTATKKPTKKPTKTATKKTKKTKKKQTKKRK
jgi:hypothetical protein